MIRWLLALGVLAALGCSPTATVHDLSSSDESTGSPIQQGTADTEHDSVGIVWLQGGGLCSGALITPTVVLTAAHCAVRGVEGFYTGEGEASVQVQLPTNVVRHGVKALAIHPSYVEGTCPNSTFDLALIELDDAANLPPMPIVSSGQGVPTGKKCVAVGYGAYSDGTYTTWGLRRQGLETVLGGATSYLTTKLATAVADHGDSGGPLICDGLIVGTTACHTDGEWPRHQIEYYARLDTASKWVSKTIASWDGAVDPVDAGSVSCSHDLCVQGEPLDERCDPCVKTICARDDACCENAWDLQCQQQVETLCHRTCTPSADAGAGDLCSPAAPKVVVSMLYTAGASRQATWGGDWVELHNPRTQPVSLDGWALQYSSASLVRWRAAPLPSGVTLGPGEFRVIYFPQTGGPVVPDSVTPDTVLQLSASAGVVALTASTQLLAPRCPRESEVVSLVGYGNVPCAEGRATDAAGPSSALSRALSGCSSLGSNDEDFVIVNAQPHQGPLACCTP